MIWLIPGLWLAYVLLFPGIRTETRAAKNALVWWYPTQSKRGNFPPAQRIHEGGGFRFGGLLALPFLIGLALAGLPLIAQALLSLLAVAGVFQITRRWIDIAEHGAEILAAEDEGADGYRAAEIARMALTDDYRGTPEGEIAKRLLGAEWRSRIILFLGSW
jgi:hypothetical protein